MSDSNKNTNAPQGLKEQRERRARINRIKVGIVLFFIVLLLACIIIDIVLAARVVSLQEQIDILAEKMIESMTPVEPDAGALQKDDSSADESDTDTGIKESTKATASSTSQTSFDVRECISSEDNIRSENEPMNVYLTFDDGPSENTPEILSILKQHGVKATFFVTGKEGEDAAEMYRAIVAEGHSLGMHSYSHKYSELYASIDSFKNDFEQLSELLYDATGEKFSLYRFPGGSSNQVSNTDMNEFIDFLGEQEVRFCDWNVASGDATTQAYTVDDLVNNVMTDVVKYKNSVVLMHDAADKDATVEALRIILSQLEEMDANILPITEDSPVIHHHISE